MTASSLSKTHHPKSTESFMLMRKSSKKASFISESSVDNDDEPVEIMGKLATMELKILKNSTACSFL